MIVSAIPVTAVSPIVAQGLQPSFPIALGIGFRHSGRRGNVKGGVGKHPPALRRVGCNRRTDLQSDFSAAR